MQSIASLLSLIGLARPSRTLATAHDLQRAGLTPLGSIGWFKQATASTHPTAGYSHIWESYRETATILRAAVPDAKVIVITSASPEEGKSTTAANLATALARDGHRVVLIDANLRWPALRNPNRDDTTFGLAELLINPALEPQQALARPSERGLYLLPSGDAPSTADGLLESPRLSEVLTALREAMDYVIIDAPPVLENGEAAAISRAADATVFVVESGKTRRRAIKRALGILQVAGISPLGAVLNCAAVSAVPATTAGGAAQGTMAALTIETALTHAFSAATPEAASVTDHKIAAEAVPVTPQPEAPKLRLIQPYERPLLPFGEQEACREVTTMTATAAPYKDPLEITVEELLVDLEETLSLIRSLRHRHASGE